jgi:serine/threonine protein kinase
MKIIVASRLRQQGLGRRIHRSASIKGSCSIDKIDRVLGKGSYGTVFGAGNYAVKAVPLISDVSWAEVANDTEDFRVLQEAINVFNRLPEECCHGKNESDIVRKCQGIYFPVYYGTLDVDDFIAMPILTDDVELKAAGRLASRTVFEFKLLVPLVLIVTSLCDQNLDKWFAPHHDWERMRPFVAQAWFAVQHMHRLGIVHNDMHMGNLMLKSTNWTEVMHSSGSNEWEVPLHDGLVLQVVDMGLATMGTLNADCFDLIGYRPNDFGADMRTLALDLATCTNSVVPSIDQTIAYLKPDGTRRTRSTVDPPGTIDWTCAFISEQCRDATEPRSRRPWLLRLMDDPGKLHRRCKEINRDRGSPLGLEDKVGNDLSCSLMALRRIACSPCNELKMIPVQPSSLIDVYLVK